MGGIHIMLQLVGFGEDANRSINKAIELADEQGCEFVYTVHVFVGVLTETKLGNSVLDYLGISKESLLDGYSELAKNDDYGRGSVSCAQRLAGGRMDSFSRALIEVVAKLSAGAFAHREQVSAQTLLQGLLDREESELTTFLGYMEITKEDIEEALENKLVIPGELEDFAKELTADQRVLSATYVGLDDYTNEIIEVLGRKKKPNPLLIGEPGVGKTAVAESFAQRVANGNVPDFLANRHILSVEGSLITAGTRFRGDFEERMKMLFDFVEETNSILFVDEIHSFMNAGAGASGAESAGNMLKARINEGSIAIIGATTRKEYKRFISNDEALCRRLETIEIREPSLDESVMIVLRSKVDYETFHGVEIGTDIVQLAGDLADRYMKSAHFPDKLYTILDHASSSAKVQRKSELTEDDIKKTVSKLTDIPVEDLDEASKVKYISLADTIKKRVIGQDSAVETVSKAILRGKSGVNNPNKPIASFLFVGPTGVGKTELCRVLSDEVAVGKESFIKIDMSEFNDEISVNKFIGSAPGYVGYEEGGQLTEKVKHNPNSIILFDEIEKAHSKVFNIFLQILEDGCLTDAEGSKVDFTNCVIVMTSNAGYGADGMQKRALGFNSGAHEISQQEKERVAMDALEQTFKPEFLNRIDNIVIFDKLSSEQCKDITKLLLGDMEKRVHNNKGILLTHTESLIDKVTEEGYSDKYGARNLRRVIQNNIENMLAYEILAGNLKGNDVAILDYSDKKGYFYTKDTQAVHQGIEKKPDSDAKRAFVLEKALEGLELYNNTSTDDKVSKKPKTRSTKKSKVSLSKE